MTFTTFLSVLAICISIIAVSFTGLTIWVVIKTIRSMIDEGKDQT